MIRLCGYFKVFSCRRLQRIKNRYDGHKGLSGNRICTKTGFVQNILLHPQRDAVCFAQICLFPDSPFIIIPAKQFAVQQVHDTVRTVISAGHCSHPGRVLTVTASSPLKSRLPAVLSASDACLGRTGTECRRAGCPPHH